MYSWPPENGSVLFRKPAWEFWFPQVFLGFPPEDPSLTLSIYVTIPGFPVGKPGKKSPLLGVPDIWKPSNFEPWISVGQVVVEVPLHMAFQSSPQIYTDLTDDLKIVKINRILRIRGQFHSLVEGTNMMQVISWHLSLGQVAVGFTFPLQFLLVPVKTVISFFVFFSESLVPVKPRYIPWFL